MSPKPRNKASMDAEAVARMMAAQDEEDATPVAETAPQEPSPQAPAVPPPPAEPPAVPAFDPGKVDGRTLRRTGREPFATRIKPETHEALSRIAYHRRITIAEEMAVAAFDRG
ncbi:hypothetical protein PQI07_31145 [Methylobacterium sp. 092160098-2]|uniref:hypothetical protein n=1 Tax=Methylobacterium sp. 092160098-2 TaxID=3025129 RepID=UPI002381B1A5|nr:hypothetical protein [Methylobacterium sp. 092160098-2]MDE4915095.1 hypothetical protein [Methylobacterium sp. 092160098-2]